MLTIFTIPKPFRGHINTIQRNAIKSWIKLFPSCEVILLGNREGLEETVEELEIKHIPEVIKNLNLISP